MAKKRLNKKVVLIGSAVFVVLALVFILLFLYLGRDPVPFIRDAEAAVKAGDDAEDEAIKIEEYEKAVRSYHKARSYAKTDALKVEVLFRLVDVYLRLDRWRDVRGCLNGIILIDPKNAKARFARLKDVYIMADSGLSQAWDQVASQASEFIEVADAQMLNEDISKWETFGMPKIAAAGQRLGPHLYLLRGRATLAMTRLGKAANPDESLVQVMDDFQKVQELEPNNVYAYWYLAQAVKTKGEILASRGIFEERDKAAERAEELLKQAIEVAPEDPTAHINLLMEKFDQSRRAENPRKQIQLLEPEYLSLVERFGSSAQAHSALCRFYQFDLESLDKAIEAAEKAVELDRENVSYAINAANMHYRKFSIHGQKHNIDRAVELAKNALTLPDAQQISGPREWANRMNRVSLYTFLADCYIEQILGPHKVRADSQKQQCLADAEQAVHEIEQLFGAGEDPQVVKWQGMLELAKGNTSIATKKLYAAYEQLKASGIEDAEPSFLGRSYAQLSYALAKIFTGTTEIGAVEQFLRSALRTNIEWTKPEAYLDYVEVLLELKAYDVALSIINSFEDKYWVDKRTRMLRIRTYIGGGQFPEAEEKLAELEPDDPNMIRLNLAMLEAKIRQNLKAIEQRRLQESTSVIFQAFKATEEETTGTEDSLQVIEAELNSYRTAYAGLVEKLLSAEPNYVGEASIVAVCNHFFAQGQLEQAKTLVNRFLEHFPDRTTILFYKQLLSEPEPDNIPAQRRAEIQKQVLLDIADTTEKAMSLGLFYRNHNEPNKAAAEFKKVLKIEVSPEAVEGLAYEPRGTEEEVTRLQLLAASYLFDIALRNKDWQLAEQVEAVARRRDLDNCQGQFFSARLAMAREQYKDALARIEECLRQRIVFSHGFMVRSNINRALGDERMAIEDIRKAASLNPLDGAIAKLLAIALYQRNQKLGDNASSDQIIEARSALDNAMRLNPGDLGLLSDYAEYISPTEPLRALAIRQYLQKTAPSVANAILLGRLATRIALEQPDGERKEALFAIAASSFEQALSYDPQNRVTLDSYAEYYRLTGQEEKAKELLAQSQDSALLWRYYLRAGQNEQARELLEQLYKADANDTSTLKALLVVAERTLDKEAAKRYSEELLLLEDTVDNYVFQIQTFLRIGLVKEAEHKLQGFKERYPKDRRVLLLEAWLALRQGQLKKALELTNRDLQTNQENAITWRLRGEANRLMANYDRAIEDLKTSKSLLDEPATRIALARAYRLAGRNEDAIIELKSTIDHPQAPMGARLLLEQIYLQLDRKEALKEFYNQTLEKLPDSVFWYNRAGAFAISENEFSRAEQLYARALEAVKGQKQIAENYGAQQLSAFRSQFSAAIDGYLRALVLEAGTPNAGDGNWNPGKLDRVFEEGSKYVDGEFAPIAYFRMAEAKLKLDDKTTAIEYCRKAVDKAGTDEGIASEILRRMYLLLGEEEVLRCCQERLKDDPESLAANLTMFSLAKTNGEYNKAVKYIDKCLQIIGDDSPYKGDYTVRKAEVLVLAYGKTSDNNYLQRAIVEYESLLAELPNNINILNNLAYMLAENNERLPEALAFAKRAIETMPDNPNLLDTYAFVCYKNGLTTEAEKFLQAALQQYESREAEVPPEVYEHLGMIKEQLGQTDEALAAYKQALEMGADRLTGVLKQRAESAIERLSQQ